MRVTWETEDGYMGGSRPQHTEVDDGDIESCDTLDEAMQMVSDAIQDDFEQKVTWYMNNRERIEEKVQEILDNREEEE